MSAAADSSAIALAQAGNSLTVAFWTTISRVTGFLRIAVIAAVLGPTFLGNAFLAIDAMPMLVLQFLAGALIGSLLIPTLVPLIDSGDRRATDEVAGGFLGAVLALAVGAMVVVIAAGGLVAELLTAGVDDPATGSEQEHVVRTLLPIVMWQLPLYALAITGGSVMNAKGRFGLAAAAPVAENVGVMAVLGSVAIAYGTGASLAREGDGPLLVLGIGSTAAVAVHAALMVWGAWRAGVRLAPRAGWRDDRVRPVLRRMAAALAETSVVAGRLFAMIVVANTVTAGVVALRMAYNFVYLPIQVGARPVALTMLPALTRLHHEGRLQEFRDQCSVGLARVGFLAHPATIGYLVLAVPIAEAVSYGEMEGTAGVRLIAACLAGMAIAVSAESLFLVLRHASYARHDARTPMISTVFGAAVSLALLPAAIVLDGRSALFALGLAMSAGSVFGAWHLRRAINSALPRAHSTSTRWVLRTFAASALMAAPAFGVAQLLGAVLDGPWQNVLVVLAASGIGAAAFLAVQRRWRSPELAFFAAGLRPRGRAAAG